MADRIRELVLLVNGERAGVVSSEGSRLSLRYDKTWVERIAGAAAEGRKQLHS